MKENDFVSQDYVPSKLIKTYSEPLRGDASLALKIFEDEEMDVKFNNIET